MTDYKYRVYDGNTGKEFADVATLKLALDILPALREFYPQVTIDEIVPGPVAAPKPPQVGDTVRGIGANIGTPDRVGTLVAIDDKDSTAKYRVAVAPNTYGIWYREAVLID